MAAASSLFAGLATLVQWDWRMRGRGGGGFLYSWDDGLVGERYDFLAAKKQMGVS
jgi:hypothetical protein